MSGAWKKCGVCKKEIPLSGIYQKCSISTCRKQAFCSVDCWSVHDSVMGHKSAYAEEERAPSVMPSESTPKRRIIVPSQSAPKNDLPMDTLIVVSKLKAYVKAKSGMNTSGDVADGLSQFVRVLVNMAIDEAHKEGRKTLMARDFSKIQL